MAGPTTQITSDPCPRSWRGCHGQDGAHHVQVAVSFAPTDGDEVRALVGAVVTLLSSLSLFHVSFWATSDLGIPTVGHLGLTEDRATGIRLAFDDSALVMHCMSPAFFADECITKGIPGSVLAEGEIVPYLDKSVPVALKKYPYDDPDNWPRYGLEKKEGFGLAMPFQDLPDNGQRNFVLRLVGSAQPPARGILGALAERLRTVSPSQGAGRDPGTAQGPPTVNICGDVRVIGVKDLGTAQDPRTRGEARADMEVSPFGSGATGQDFAPPLEKAPPDLEVPAFGPRSAYKN